uniref:Uncharacterized protein n=1 Tax=Anguilla anguilla TaxID=7936 RepID=A0A0E9RV85_ANGAN
MEPTALRGRGFG